MQGDVLKTDREIYIETRDAARSLQSLLEKILDQKLSFQFQQIPTGVGGGIARTVMHTIVGQELKPSKPDKNDVIC